MFRRFRHALHGLAVALRRRELLHHVVIAALVIVLGFLLCLDSVHWALLVLAIGLVLTAETVNTALEELSDAVSPHRHPGVRRAKDVSAAAVLIAAGSAALLGFIVFLPPLIQGNASGCLPQAW